MIWSAIENHIAVVVACAPSIKVVVVLIFPRLASSLGKFASYMTPSTSGSQAKTPVLRENTADAADVERGPSMQSGIIKVYVSTAEEEFVDDFDELKPLPQSLRVASFAHGIVSGAGRAIGGCFKKSKSGGGGTDDVGLVYVQRSYTVERSED